MTTTIIGVRHAGSALARDLVLGGERVLLFTPHATLAQKRGMEPA